MSRRIPGVLFLFLLACGSAASTLWAADPAPAAEPEKEPAYRLYLSVKGAWHNFWNTGLFSNSAEYGRPGMGASELMGIGGEAEADVQFSRHFLVAATVGAYGGGSGQYDVDIITGYGLLTAKLQNPGKYADYYVGLGLGGYLSRLSADGDSYAMQPGIHGLAGIRIHVTPSWSVLVEDRVAFTLRAKGGFGDLDLGGNFVLLGCSYGF